MKKEMCCIVCPMSCQLCVEYDDHDQILSVSGNRCPRGETYAKSEALDPQRMVTTTVRIHNALHPLLPVITSKHVSKAKIFDIMSICKNLEVTAPVMMNDIIVKNIADSKADLLASRTMEQVTQHDQSKSNSRYHKL